MNTQFDEDEERKKLQEVIDFFSELIDRNIDKTGVSDVVVNKLREMPPAVKGECSCCFKPSIGYFLAYQFADLSVHQCFVCVVCVSTCPPQDPCKFNNWTSGLKMIK